MILPELNVPKRERVNNGTPASVLSQCDFFYALATRQQTKLSNATVDVGLAAIRTNSEVLTDAKAFLGALTSEANSLDSNLRRLVQANESVWLIQRVTRRAGSTSYPEPERVALLEIKNPLALDAVPLEFLLSYGWLNKHQHRGGSESAYQQRKLVNLPAVGVISAKTTTVKFNPNRIVVGPTLAGHLGVYRMIAGQLKVGKQAIAFEQAAEQPCTIVFAILHRIE